MQARLEVSLRDGKPYAGYYDLRCDESRRVVSSRRWEAGLVIDQDETGQALGIEITSPGLVDAGIFNRLLLELGEEPVEERLLAPLTAA